MKKGTPVEFTSYSGLWMYGAVGVIENHIELNDNEKGYSVWIDMNNDIELIKVPTNFVTKNYWPKKGKSSGYGDIRFSEKLWIKYSLNQ